MSHINFNPNCNEFNYNPIQAGIPLPDFSGIPSFSSEESSFESPDFTKSPSKLQSEEHSQPACFHSKNLFPEESPSLGGKASPSSLISPPKKTPPKRVSPNKSPYKKEIQALKKLVDELQKENQALLNKTIFLERGQTSLRGFITTLKKQRDSDKVETQHLQDAYHTLQRDYLTLLEDYKDLGGFEEIEANSSAEITFAPSTVQPSVNEDHLQEANLEYKTALYTIIDTLFQTNVPVIETQQLAGIDPLNSSASEEAKKLKDIATRRLEELKPMNTLYNEHAKRIAELEAENLQLRAEIISIVQFQQQGTRTLIEQSELIQQLRAQNLQLQQQVQQMQNGLVSLRINQ